jgi:glycosyltransferase involved in cell wall biosynthesis
VKKKVGLLISSLNGGGAERVVSRLSMILYSEYDIYILLFDAKNIKYDYKGRVIDIKTPANSKGLLSKIKLLMQRTHRTRAIKKTENLDIVISFLDSPNIVNILSKNKGCKVAISIRNYTDIGKKPSRILKLANFFMKRLYKKADLVIPVSKEISKMLFEKYFISKSKLKVIYNPYDIIDIERLANEDIEDKYENFMRSEKIFISVGRQVYQKGYWHLVKAFKLVLEKEPDAKLIIIGSGNNDVKLMKLINDLGIENRVLLTGFQKNPFKFIKKSQVYIMTSLFEGFPNALVEAMACGCPVISTDCKSGPKEILLENFNFNNTTEDILFGDYGILVPVFKEGENWDSGTFETEEYLLSEAMISLLRDKEKLKYYSRKSIERAKTFNYERCFKKYKSLIEEV